MKTVAVVAAVVVAVVTAVVAAAVVTAAAVVAVVATAAAVAAAVTSRKSNFDESRRRSRKWPSAFFLRYRFFCALLLDRATGFLLPPFVSRLGAK